MTVKEMFYFGPLNWSTSSRNFEFFINDLTHPFHSHPIKRPFDAAGPTRHPSYK